MSDQQILTICQTLQTRDVRYVVIGGAAAQLHGADIGRTADLDIVPEDDERNLDRLAEALHALDARMWTGPGAPAGLAVPFHQIFRSPFRSFLNLVTSHGPMDVNFTIDGFPAGYQQLEPGSERRTVLGLSVPVASLADVIASKQAAGRPKDFRVLPILIRLARQQR